MTNFICPCCGVREQEKRVYHTTIRTVSQGQEPVTIVYCADCGHLYDVFAEDNQATA